MHKHPTARHPASVSIGLFGFIMSTSAALLGIRTFPVEGLPGWQSATSTIAAILMYLLSAAFVTAEPASGRPGEGGAYEWAKGAFGQRPGLTAVWIRPDSIRPDSAMSSDRRSVRRGPEQSGGSSAQRPSPGPGTVA
jgi:hypothetical protein